MIRVVVKKYYIRAKGKMYLFTILILQLRKHVSIEAGANFYAMDALEKGIMKIMRSASAKEIFTDMSSQNEYKAMLLS